MPRTKRPERSPATTISSGHAGGRPRVGRTLARVSDCVFCAPEVVAAAVARHGSVYALPDKNPVSSGHHLIVPFRHTTEFFEMTDAEHADALLLLRRLHEQLIRGDPTVAGFNVGANCGEVAGQTIRHAHIHLIPRRPGDTPRWRGGVRGVIPERMDY